MRPAIFAFLLVPFFALSGCGYHTLGSASHLPPDVRTLSVPVFSTRTETYGVEAALTDAVIREFEARSKFRATPSSSADADAVLHGIIVKEIVSPLTYNSATQQSSSFLITLIVSVKLTARDGRVLYDNKNYTFRQQYQSTTDLPTFIQEDPAAVQRIAREFARQLVADVLEGF
jgi:outer membrane lipopolysaccharide assembly protein LptE/RlpB